MQHQSAGLRWGWGIDHGRDAHKNVLYVDLPTGQVSFHTEHRGEGPKYPGTWDGMKGVTVDRILRWVARVLDGRHEGATQ